MDAPLSGYDAIVCDLDGVVFRGSEPVPGAGDALRDFIGGGGRVAYATNNSSRRVGETTENIATRNAPVDGQVVITSALAGAAAIARALAPGARVLALGGPGVAEALEREGLTPVAPRDAIGTDVGSGVLQGLGPTLTVDDFAEAARWLQSGCAWVATNGDATLPVEWGEAPGNGAYVGMLARTSRREPDIVGKPAPDIYDLCLEALGCPQDRVLAVGDRLETDIDGARAAGIASALVLTGVSRPADVLELSDDARPTIVADSLAALLDAQAGVQRTEDGARCGSATVRLDPGGSDGPHVQVAGESLAEVTRAALAVLDGATDEQVRRAVVDAVRGHESA